MAEQLTREGFHSARSSTITPRTVQKIRLARGWSVRFDLLRNAEQWDNCWTVNGLAKQLGVNESTIYHFIREKIIPPEFILHEPRTGIYLFANDPALLDPLQKRVAANKKKMSTPPAASSQTV